ncbi:MAG: calcium-binding protein [Xenococcaceae cyanobacterium MO_234.B1]|nr:calcium-binding protein [Xenococcaceae cyanobacterium MO_234.B1]
MLSVNEVFNESYYLETNPEAAEAVERGDFASGLEHFEAVGLDEGLRFTPLIDLDYYKRVANPDLVELSNREALDNLLETGIEEGRIFSQFIDLEFYKEANPDISDLSNSEALIHLRDIGLDAGLEFSSFVDLEEYRSFNPDLADSSLSENFTELATFFAPEDEGRIRFPLNSGLSIPDELQVIPPEVSSGSAEATITYSKSANEVTLDLDIDGLPYRETFTRPEDVSTPFNRQPVTVEDAKWQVWVVGEWFTEETNFWYDGQTGELLGSEFDLFDEPSGDATPIDVNGDGVLDTSLLLPTAQAIGSPIFEGNPDGTAQVSFDFTYDQLLDERGTAGVYVGALPYNLNSPQEVGIYYTEGGLPLSEAMTWDDILGNIRNGNLLNITVSVEPDPKPQFLDSRPNTMEAWNGLYPTLNPDGIVLDALTNTHRFAEPEDTVSHVNEPWPVAAAAQAAETEQVFGSLENDEFDAANPNDDFDGNRDTIFTGAGDDFVDASQASAPLFPGTVGHNRIFGGTGLDELLASRRDLVSGGTGDDILDASAGAGNNRLYGEEGNDELFAGESDRLFAGAGDDILDATTGSGNNRLYGQDDNDTFFLGSGDRLLGGDGDDAFFVTDGGDNLITGGAGADAFWIATGELITTANTITDFELDGDVIGVAGIGATSIDDLEFNQVGNDAVISFSNFDLATLINTQASDLAADGTFVFA